MFGIGFTELLLIAVVTLLVVGPEKLPETVRAISINLAKIRRFWSSARQEFEREVGMDEIRREIHNAEVMEQLKQTKATLENNPAKKELWELEKELANSNNTIAAGSTSSTSENDTTSPESADVRRSESDSD